MVDRDSLQGLSREERKVVRSSDGKPEAPLPPEVVVETIEAFKRDQAAREESK